MKHKLLTFILALTASISTLFAASGTCGDNLTWDLTDGVLTISGTGRMADYLSSSSASSAPWFSSRSDIKIVNIGDGVTSIGGEAFYYCTNLTSVTIPNSVTSIGEQAFSGCSSLTSVTIPNSVTSIGYRAFSDCSSLTSVTIPNSVTSIENYTFSECISLTSVVIPNSVTSIGEDAFIYCSSLTSVVIPNSVTSIGYDAFYQVPNIVYSGSATGSPWGARSINGYVDGYLVYSDNTKTTLLACSTAAQGEIVIPNGVTSIGYGAFSYYTNLTSVTIPNSVTSIGSSAFCYCTNLTSVTIGNSVTSIGEEAFYDCSSLTSMTIPNSVTSIGRYAFSGCTGLTSVTIPNSVTSIGDGAFRNVCNIVYNGTATGSPWGARNINGYVDGYLVYSDNTKTTLLACSTAAQGEIVIPNSVTSIGANTFYGCSSLTAVHISDMAAWCAISFENVTANPLNYAQNLYLNGELVTDLVIPNTITSIGNYAFFHCTGLTSVTIPNSVTSIGDDAFSNCTGLTSVTIPNSVTSIGNRAFASCRGLTSVTIGNSVTSIGDYAFSNCTGLTSVTIPNSVTSIGEYAFANCRGLTSVTIPNSVTSIGYDAFYRVPNIVYSGSATGSPWGARSINGYVDGYLFYSDNTKTTLLACSTAAQGEIVIPNSVTRIDSSAFYFCTNLTSVMIPNSVTSIGNSAFYYCTNLTSVTIPNSVTSIGDYAFESCSSLTSVHISDIASWCAISFGNSSANPLDFAHNLYLNGTLVTDLVIPNSVTSIENYTFSKCSSLTSVVIPNSVTSIGVWAFYGCSSLTSVTIPNSVTSIGNYAFSGCTSLTSVTIPNSVTSIGYRAFSGCTGLTFVTIGNSVTSIGEYAFANCRGLTSVTIGNSVTSIGKYAFEDCTGLTSVTIPNSVTSIGNRAFANCTGLKYVLSYPEVPPTVYRENDPFYGIDENTPFYVSNLEAYQEAKYWKDLNLQTFYSAEKSENATSVAIHFTHKAWDLNKEYIVSCGIEGGEQQPGNVLEYIGLEPNREYKDVVVLTSNTGETGTVNISFTTTALELTTKPSKPVSATTAILLAETNMSDVEVNCGFEYKRNDAPADMAGTKVYCPVASGQMAGRLKNLKDDVYYKYRAFYQSAAGNMYYGDWQYIFTGDNAIEFDPILYTYTASVVTETGATLSGYALAGSEDFTEQGFEVWAESHVEAQGGNSQSTSVSPRRMTAALGEHFFVQASGIALRVTLTNLDAGTVYKYRVYGKVGSQYYYGSEQTFTTTGTYTPSTYTITFVNWDGTELQSSQVTENSMPEYTGELPTRPNDNNYSYSFTGWTPEVVVATADATYTATFEQTVITAIGDVQNNDVECSKIIRNGKIFILRGNKTYTLQGQEVKF